MRYNITYYIIYVIVILYFCSNFLFYMCVLYGVCPHSSDYIIIRQGREKTKKFAIKIELKVFMCFINTSHTTILTRDVRVKIIPFKINPIEFHLDTHIVCVIVAVTLKKKKKKKKIFDVLHAIYYTYIYIYILIFFSPTTQFVRQSVFFELYYYSEC